MKPNATARCARAGSAAAAAIAILIVLTAVGTAAVAASPPHGRQPARAPVAPAAVDPADGSAVAHVAAGGGTIPLIRTAHGLTTMISLPEEAKEAICGDLYDP